MTASGDKRRPPAAGKGRPKGATNKTTRLLKDAILQAAEQAGGRAGIVGYLRRQAEKNPGPFLSLLGKVLPTQVTGEDGGPVQIEQVQRDADEFASRVLRLASARGLAPGDGKPEPGDKGGA